MIALTNISERLNSVRENIIAAAERSGRHPSDIGLVVISKKHPIEKMREALDAGVSVFGESRLQEASVKIPLLPARTRFHFIGHLQKNKLRKLLPLFELFHSIDSLELALEMDRIASDLGLFPRVLLEVNISAESSKYGFVPHDLENLLEKLLSLPRLQVEGFMTMAPLSDDPETSRSIFSQLRLLRDQLAIQAGIPLPTLSMGMSNDYEVAVEEGATLVRVGSAIFGKQ
ncbi:MAG: YggS family pyridoxal phosphate-dependent enzyme [Verrucomicrobia bacterium]|nr:MAG: YggS family pyridoxal phosphate-dependent enzyme [Verrucomicrobiota bacterium]